MDPEGGIAGFSPELSALLFEQAADGMFVAEPQGRLIAVNPRLCDLLGYAAAEALGRPFLDFTDPEDLRANPLRADELCAGAIVISERPLRSRDGRLIPVELTTRKLPDGRLLGVARDITERKRAEEALRESEVLLSATQRLSRIGGWEYDIQGQAMTWTDETFRLHDLVPDQSASLPTELVSRSAACYPPEVRTTILDAFYRCVEQGVPYDLEVPFTSVQGRAMWVRTMAKAVRRGERIVKVLGTFMDVTERRRMEEDLRESERRFSSVMETMSLIGVMLDTEGHITFCNDFLLNLTGWTREEVLGRLWFELFLPPEIRSEIRNKVFLSTIQDGQVPVHHENEIVTRSGSRRLVAWNNTVLRDHAGKVAGTASVGEDITDRRKAEQARLEMERRLLHSQKLESLGVLAGGIAHDFNNLLMAILGNLELGLSDLSPASPARPRLAAASGAARRAADLTRQMLAYSGRGKFMVERVDLNELVEENACLLRSSIARTAALNLHLDPALPAVEADVGQLQQVVMNLITNASEALGSDPGVITLSTGARDCDGSYLSRNQLEETPPAGRYVYFEVTDNGCGMDEQTQKRMFDPFFTTKFTGRGLGLPAVFGIVRGHGGAILLDSAEGKGTTIRVLFPAVEPAPGAAVPTEGAFAGVAETSAPIAGRGTVLIADDEEMVLQLCAEMVESLGFAVLTATDGEQAVEMVRRHGAEIRAIILDLTMPKLDGAGAFERILLIEPDAKVILSSGYDEAEATGRLAKERLAGFISKPYDLGLLRSALDQALTS